MLCTIIIIIIIIIHALIYYNLWLLVILLLLLFIFITLFYIDLSITCLLQSKPVYFNQKLQFPDVEYFEIF